MKRQDFVNSLDTKTYYNISATLRKNFEFPCSLYGVEIEDFIQSVFTTANHRGKYDASRSSLMTYVFWIARSEMSHIKESADRKAKYGQTIYFEDYTDDHGDTDDVNLFSMDHSLWANPLDTLIAQEEYIEALDRLSEHFDCTMASVERLLQAERKELISVAKAIAVEELMTMEEAQDFICKVRSAKANGGFYA